MGSQIGENYNSLTRTEPKAQTGASFGCFICQVLAERADASDFNISRTADSKQKMNSRVLKSIFQNERFCSCSYHANRCLPSPLAFERLIFRQLYIYIFRILASRCFCCCLFLCMYFGTWGLHFFSFFFSFSPHQLQLHAHLLLHLKKKKKKKNRRGSQVSFVVFFFFFFFSEFRSCVKVEMAVLGSPMMMS